MMAEILMPVGSLLTSPRLRDYEECAICGVKIPAMTLCYVTKPRSPVSFALQLSCYERHVVAKR